MPSIASLRALVTLSMACALPAVAQTARVVGTVRDGAGVPIVSVEVGLEGTDNPVRSDSLGRFTLVRLPRGTVRLHARRLGYKPESIELTLSDTNTVTANIRLDVLAQIVETVTITGRKSASDRRLEGFYARSRSHNGGHFVTRDEIERRTTVNALQLLRGIPGLKILGDSRYGRGVRLRGKPCPPLVFIDGFPASAGPYDFESVDPASVEGIEVYAGIGSVPPEFLGPRLLDQCGVIAIWGRQAPAGREISRPRKLTDTDRATARVKGMVAASLAYMSNQVDTVAMLERGTFAPVYPLSLEQNAITARVQVEFVVDTAGIIAWETYSIVSTSDHRFDIPVREALQLAKFSPATRAGRRVAQVVQVAAVIAPPEPAKVPPPR